MKMISKIEQMKLFSGNLIKKGKKTGFVPTMGALHEGHIALVKAAKKDCDVVIVSIFVNPIQFGPKEDFKKYPRTLSRDRALLNKLGVDAVFYPSAYEMFPKGFNSFVEVERLGEKLCGISRPDHFKGVTTVVAKLFNIVKPGKAYFGAKDFQQQAIIRKMIKDLNIDVEIVTVPTLREKDGLAMSSRNIYLSEKERKTAPAIYCSLQLAKMLFNKGEKSTDKLILAVKKHISQYPPIKIDYVEIVDPETLAPLSKAKSGAVIVIAAHLGKTRLIDNILL